MKKNYICISTGKLILFYIGWGNGKLKISIMSFVNEKNKQEYGFVVEE